MIWYNITLFYMIFITYKSMINCSKTRKSPVLSTLKNISKISKYCAKLKELSLVPNYFCYFLFIYHFYPRFLLFQTFFPQPQWFNISKFFTPLQNSLLWHLSWRLETEISRKGLYTLSQQNWSYKYLWNNLECSYENLTVIPCFLVYKIVAIYNS